MAGGYGKRDWSQPKGWDQSGPYQGQRKGAQKGGWRQHDGWRQQEQAQQPGPWRSRAEGHDWGGRRHEGQQRRGGPWRGLQEVAGAARVAVEAATALRSLVAPQPAEQPPGAQGDPTSRGWLATARGWLLGESTPPPQGCLQSAPPVAPQAPPPAEQLLSRLLGGETAARAPPPPGVSQQDLLAQLSQELSTQRQVLAILVERVDPQGRKVPLPLRDASPPRTPAVPRLRDTPRTPRYGGDDDDDKLNTRLLETLALLRKEQGEPPLSSPGADGSALPLVEDTRLAPAKAAFDTEGEVTPEGHARFWSWLDDTPKAPWPCSGQYANWAKKMAYKCSVADLHRWARLKTPSLDDAALQARSREELVNTLAKAAMEAAPTDPSGGGQPGQPRQRSLAELPGVIRTPRSQ
jgi:hypothetical protein